MEMFLMVCELGWRWDKPNQTLKILDREIKASLKMITNSNLWDKVAESQRE